MIQTPRPPGNRRAVIRIALSAAPALLALGVVLAVAGEGSAAVLVATLGAVVLAAASGVLLGDRAATRVVVRAQEEAEDATRDAESRLVALRRDRTALEQILAAMEEGVVLIGEDDETAFSNPAARRLLDGAPESLRSLAPHPLRAFVEQVRTDSKATSVEVETGLPPSTLRATAVPMGGGRVLLVVRDVTASRRVEAMRRDFVADASHELKTPVAAIQAAAETVERAVSEDPEAASRFARRLRRDAVRLGRIVSDLLDLSRLETAEPARGRVRLDRVVRDEAARLAGDAGEAGVTVELETSPVTVQASRGDVALLLRNLLDNAVRYTPSGGKVRVEVNRNEGHAWVTVTDTGIGIPRRDLPRVFERFYRVDRARSRETGGTGLGLSIAKHVAERYGGRIEARSELGQGSTFTVTLPLAERTDPD